MTDGVAEASRRIAVRYLGEVDGAAYADAIEDEEVIVGLEPGIVRGLLRRVLARECLTTV